MAVDTKPILDALKADLEPHVQAIAASLLHKGVLPLAQAYAKDTGSALVIGVEGAIEPAITAVVDQAIASIKL